MKEKKWEGEETVPHGVPIILLCGYIIRHLDELGGDRAERDAEERYRQNNKEEELKESGPDFD